MYNSPEDLEETPWEHTVTETIAFPAVCLVLLTKRWVWHFSSTRTMPNFPKFYLDYASNDMPGTRASHKNLWFSIRLLSYNRACQDVSQPLRAFQDPCTVIIVHGSWKALMSMWIGSCRLNTMNRYTCSYPNIVLAMTSIQATMCISHDPSFKGVRLKQTRMYLYLNSKQCWETIEYRGQARWQQPL